MTIEQFSEPYATCCFIDDDKVFVNLFHNQEFMHYHFILDLKKGKIIGSTVSRKLEKQKKNFPLKCFYNSDKNEIYSFYRQGDYFIINADLPDHYEFGQIKDIDVLGQAILVYNEALIIKGSSEICMYKLVYKEKNSEERHWEKYKELNYRGMITYIKGNIRFNLVTEDKIYFFLVDKETLLPTLENVMFNYMQCQQMMFGSKVKYGITFKTNERSFTIYKRKYENCLSAPVIRKDFEGSKALELHTARSLVVTKKDQVFIYDANTFKKIEKLEISLLKSEEREPNEVIAI